MAITISLSDDCIKRMERLADRWGYSPIRHKSHVIERAVLIVSLLENPYEFETLSEEFESYAKWLNR